MIGFTIGAVLRRTVLFLSLLALPAFPALASAQGRDPRTEFTTADFATLRWLEGTWRGTTPGQATFHERYHFASPSSIEITYFDSTMKRVTGHGRVYLAGGRIYYTFGPGRWIATTVSAKGAHFVPQTNATNTFVWEVTSPNSWTSTAKTSAGGRGREHVAKLERVTR